MSYENFLANYPTIKQHSDHSKSTLTSLREDLTEALHNSPNKEKITIVTTGSYGRREASAASDLDLFIFFDSDRSEDVLTDEKNAIKSVVDKYIEKASGDTGTFGPDAIIKFDGMLKNIGGDSDLNKDLTRRMLFLLEGTWLYSEKRFNSYRTELLTKYIKSGNPEKQISRFLLNDVIRYYRTITTDFEFKVTEDKKSWGLRNIKLRFSRKILYFGGIISIAETALISNTEKNTELSALFDKTVLERIYETGKNNPETPKIFEIYQEFLEKINTPANRDALDCVTKENREESPLFLAMREKSKEFSLTLDRWLKTQYTEISATHPHPIHNALIF